MGREIVCSVCPNADSRHGAAGVGTGERLCIADGVDAPTLRLVLDALRP